MIGPKVKAWRSRPYRMYVASFPCFACGIWNHSQAAHQNEGKGGAIKTDDSLCFPLCTVRPGHMGCHEIFDLALDDETREERHVRARGYVARMQSQAAKDGWKLPGVAMEREAA